jgi:hypothetical protein
MSLPPAYTEQLAAVVVTPGGSTSPGGPAAGKRWIVTDIQARMINDGAPHTLGLIIGLGFGNPWSWQCPAFGRNTVHWHGRQVVDNGDTLLIQSDGLSGDPGECDVEITGYDVTVA